MATKKKAEYVVVCTDKRGVFGGYLESGDVGQICVLRDARMCLYWSRATGSVLGLSQSGPRPDCRIGEAAPSLRLQDVHCIMECSATAQEAWEKAPVFRG